MRRVPNGLPVPGSRAQPETVRPLALAGRIAVLALDLAGVLVAAPSGIGLFWFIPFAGVGTFVVFRRPRISIGWLLLALAWIHVLQTVTLDATVVQFADGSLVMPMRFAGWLLGSSGLTLFLLYATLMLVFPSGHLPRSHWGTLARIGIGIGMGLVIATAFAPTINVTLTGYPSGVRVQNPFPIAPDLPIWQILGNDATFPPLLVLMAASAVSVVVRFRRAVGIERQQLRWMGASVMLVMIGLVGGLVTSGLFPSLGESGVVWIAAIVAFPTIPISIGVAVLRYRLFEIDRIISRTISWALTTGVIGVLFAGIVVGLQGVLAQVTGGNTVAVAGSTLIVAALFQPLRRRVQHAVDRRFNRARYDSEQTLAAFGEQVRAEIDLATLSDAVLATADEAVRPAAAGLWLRGAAE